MSWNFSRYTTLNQKDIRNLYISVKRRILRDNIVVIVGSTWKVGSTWLYNLIKDLDKFEKGQTLIPKDYYNFEFLLNKPGAVDIVNKLKKNVILKTHSLPVEGLNENVKIVSVYRDPRDVVISSIFYLSNIEVSKGGWGEEFIRYSNKDKIKVFLERSELWISKMEQWFETPLAYKLSYESLKADSFKELKKIVYHIGLTCSDIKIEKAIDKNSFQAKSGRNPGEENRSHILRKGIQGDWKNFFDDEIIHYFKKSYNGRWNKLVVEMGYEKTLDW